MTFAPSVQQQAFYDWVRTGRGSAVVISVAGSGKTTAIMGAQEFIPDSAFVQILAFNSIIGKELKARLDVTAIEKKRDFSRRRAGTFHSLGFGAVCKKLGKPAREIEVDGKKLRNLIRIWLDEEQADLYGEYIAKLVDYAKGDGIGALVPDTEDRWYGLVQHHDLYLDSEDADEATGVRLARELLKRSNEAARLGHIDFADQLYLPLLWRLRLWQHDWVFIDECQDTSPVRRALARLALKPGGRLVAVGDPHQAIYGFTGASHDAIELIKTDFNAIELPLSVCYRCASSIVECAQEVVGHIQPSPTAAVGTVEWTDLKAALTVLDSHDAILCRNTAPLIEAAYSLIAQGRGCVVLGKEIGAGLVNLIKKQKTRGIDALVAKLDRFADREATKFIARGEDQKAEALRDRITCINTIIDHLPENARTLPELILRIEAIFSDTNGVLTLSTMHKAKGREWRRVAILCPELLPSKWAKQPWQQAQETNLDYVARTRAMEHLMFLQSASKGRE